MPISINSALTSGISSKLAHAVYHIENPNYQTGTLLEEVPADLGRSWEGYKRGGLLEGAEKLRKETMAAVVWLFGIPAFNWLGKNFCEKLLHLPMDMDFSDATKGNDAIGDSIRYLKDPKNFDLKGRDASELKQYLGDSKMMNKIKENSEQVIKQVQSAKKITSIAAVVLNCIMMGIVIPKINQAMTQKKMDKMNAQKQAAHISSMDEFTKKAQNSKVSFTGDLLGTVAYKVENDNKFRLIITDVPMILGRMATSRNKYEALEYAVIDGGSVYFYNFAANHIRDILRGAAHVPAINPLVAHTVVGADKEALKGAIDKLIQNKEDIKATKDKTVLEQLFSKDISQTIYSQATFGKYGKLNRFVSNEAIQDIDSEVVKYLKTIAQKAGYKEGAAFNYDNFIKEAKKYNNKNAAFLAVGLIVSIYGLARLMPKLAYKLTTLLTGKNTFTGIEKYDDDKKKE